jgi:hypothetical protein
MYLAKSEGVSKVSSISIFTTDQSADLFDLMKKHISLDYDYVISGNPNSPLFSEFSSAKKIIGGPSLDSINKAIAFAKQSPYKLDVIAYDIEHWPMTPQEEQNDPAGTINKGADLVHEAGYRYGITPDGRYLLDYYQKIDWKKVDLLDMQFQRRVSNSDEFVKYVSDVTKFAKSVNPNIEVLVQVSLVLSSPDQILTAVDKVQNVVDGVVVAYLPAAAQPNNMSTVENLNKVLSGIERSPSAHLDYVVHEVTAQGYDFSIFVATNNSTVNSLKFEKEKKQVSLTVEGQEGTTGFVDLVIPTTLLSGNFTVYIDGNNVNMVSITNKYQLNNPTSVSEKEAQFALLYRNETSTEIRIGYIHSSHTINIVGTNVVPEFPAAVIFSVASIVAVFFAMIYRRVFGRRAF